MIAADLRQLVAVAALGTAAGTAQVPPAAPTAVTEALRQLVADPRLAGGRVGVHVRDLADGKTVAQHDDDKGFMTASNMKLISSAVALLTLGPDFTFVTRLVAHGHVRDGVLDGDLVLVGDGDPTLGGRHEAAGPRAPLLRLAHQLRAQHGITHVTGAVLGDDDCQPDEVLGEGWAWGYEAADYAAQISGLCLAENVVRLEFLPTEAGRQPGVRLLPETSYVTLDAAVRATEASSAVTVGRARGSNVITVRGTVTAGKPHRDAASIDNPTAFAAHVLHECLREASVHVRGPARDRDDWARPLAGPGEVLGEERSPPLHAVLRTLNQDSQNLYAEQLVRTAARVATGKAAMRDASAHAKQVLAASGVGTRGMVLADGSGLSRLNLVPPRAIADLLGAMWRHPHRDVFVRSLPLAGSDGTLRARFAEGPARGRVRAKTGFISRVVALSGYVPRPTQGAEPLVFAILLNNFTCEVSAARDAVDTFVQELARAAGW
jgi:D-alanyl-D-alanine carboxypeptidase/D-alanyl-D-alanine-endopeptidase (penicillin-binding protein 4)